MFILLERQPLGMIRWVMFGFSKDFCGEHAQNETSTIANTDSTSVCWMSTL